MYLINQNKIFQKNQLCYIYNSKFSVSPLTTHVPLKKLNKKINQKNNKLCKSYK